MAGADLSAQRLYGLVLAGRKELPALLRARSWDPGGKDRGRLLHGATVVIAGDVASGDGTGAAAAAGLVALLAPTGAHVERVSGAGQVVPTAGADVVVLLPGAAPLGAEELALLPEGAVLIDASAPDEPAARAVDAGVLADGLAIGRPLHAAVLVSVDQGDGQGDGQGGDLGGDPAVGHALWSSPRALVVPVGSGS